MLFYCAGVLFLLVLLHTVLLPLALLQQQPNFPTGINKLSCYLNVKYMQASVRK